MATAPTTAKARAVQMPGEPVQTNPESESASVAGLVLTGDTAGDEPEHPAVIALRELEAKLAAAEARLAERTVDKGESAQVFDVTKPHQTGKGWIVPETHGTPVKKG